MNFEQLLSKVGGQPCFDFAMLAQLTDEKRESLRARLYEWRKAGKLLPLRRGMYAFAEPYRRTAVNAAQLSNLLYTPSYLSMHWALSHYGLIPEKTVAFTAMTSRVPRTFGNDFGTYSYRNIKQSAFFGYVSVELGGRPVSMALPEKALLDLWHIQRGEWSAERMREMRFQNHGLVDDGKLADFAERFASPRLSQAVRIWQELASEEQEGTVEL
jgi:predicted transcriptional regulator of viral defense system